ncbi:PAS/PAC sensor hybrid histidine kinase [Faunimonas pinastri]|uniref:histidine kinase n=1 Tax=Faunimonas pinastri TaxID=1855383 RepID=A0A1H9QLT9_9HYPH|nr:PAS domain-containing sensor histidine kinase [Faunimonas pinastri]SER61377.1 PAS/PAC sensor hybrid histidine kinase [Faunimonas pinastri]
MSHRTAAEGYRVLIAAPYGRDAESLAEVLASHGYEAHVLPGIDAIGRSLDARLGAILLTEEALTGDLAPLGQALAGEPPWSDIPFLLLAGRPSSGNRNAQALRRYLPEAATNVVILERPLGAESLVSTVAAALRSRQKQFEMRDRLLELDNSRQALASSVAELQLVADSLPVLIGFLDRDLRYRFANRTYREWFDRAPDEVIGRRLEEIMPREALDARMPAIRRALAGETTRIELDWPHPDGSRRDAEIRYLPRRDAAGEVDGFYTFVLDVTDRKLVEEELERRVVERTEALNEEMVNRAAAEAALRQSLKMEAVGQLTGGIAHDFNNMLTGVIGSLAVLKRRIASGRMEDVDRFMDAANTSAQRAASLTARLLAFSRRQSLDAKALDVNQLVGSLDDLLRRSIGEQVDLRVVASEGLPAAVADANQLENAILNLAINARDAMPEGGQLTIETSLVELDEAYAAAKPDVKPGRYVMVAVSDTGVGIAPDVLEKVYEPFFTTKPIGQGTGLGLSMVYGFARQSGGQVRIHSREGEGTSVKLYLPVADDAVFEPAADLPAAPSGRGQSVLLVEDDQSVRLLVREVLAELGYSCVEVPEAQAAIRVLSADRPIDLLISDVGLPGMNGRQLAEIARQHRPDLPILFITGYAENAAIRAGFLGTNMGMITKPFALDLLAHKIGEMLMWSAP